MHLLAIVAPEHSFCRFLRFPFLMLQKDYQSLELELARSRVSVNRVAVAAASEWKEDSDKVIPVKQWVEERKYLQGEMRQLQVSQKSAVRDSV
jgi:hypothetical protein